MNKNINVIEGKILSLKNVVYCLLNFENNKDSVELKIEKIRSYILSKGFKIRGPLILLTQVSGEKNKQISIFAMFQIEEENIKINPPYQFEPIMKIGPCLYARYEGKEENVNIAQSKIRVYAFENDILLSPKVYSVFVDNDGKGKIVVDIFIPIILKKESAQ